MALSLAASPALSLAQGRAIDEGTYVLTRGGAVIGTESFQVQRVPGQALIRITAMRTVGDQRTTAWLTADSLGTPEAFSLTVKQGSVTELSLKAMAAPGRLSSTWQDRRGNEAMKEFVVAPAGTVILDDELANPYYFSALHRRGGGVKVISPRAGRDFPATLVAGGLEPIDVGGRKVTATRYTLTGAGGGSPRDFWVDAAGRVLRVVLPGGVTATREELPR